jgi:hypothetical protein
MELNDTQKLVLLTKLGFCVDAVARCCYESYKDAKLAINASYNYIAMAYERTYEEVDEDLHAKAEKIRLAESSRYLPKIFKTNKRVEGGIANFELLAKNLREISQLVNADSSILQTLQLTRFSSDQNLDSYKKASQDLAREVTEKFLQDNYELTQIKGKTPTQLRQMLDSQIERIAFDSENSYLKSVENKPSSRSR